MMNLSFMQAAEYVAAISRAVAEDNAQATTVLISGASGWWSEAINGFFAPTQEKGLDGRVVYSKCGSGDMCIVHRGGRWEVINAESKFRDGSVAVVTGGCSLKACGSCQFKVNNHSDGKDKQTLTIEAGSEVEQKARLAPQSSHVHRYKHHFINSTSDAL